MTQNLILGLDIGTSGIRAALFDRSGGMLPETLVSNQRGLIPTDDGGFEIDADKALRQVIGTIDDVLRASRARKGNITHVASCAFWHSLVGVDEKGKPTTKVLGWADTRSRKYTARLRKRFDERETHNRTGARFHSSFWPAKLLWLRNEMPDAFSRTALWLSLSDFIALRLFGIATTSISMASATGVFDIRTMQWEASLLRFLAVKPANVPLVSAGAYTFRLLEKYRRRWARLKNAEWFPLIGDGAANNIGAGCVRRSRAALMIGTSGAMRVAYEGEPPEKIPNGLWCYRIDSRRVIIGGALSDGGGLYGWVRDLLRLDDKAENEIAGRQAAGHGLVFLPFVAGERSTGYHEDATGVVAGLRPSTDSLDVLQAALESVAYRFAKILDELNTVVRVREIVASGGAIQSSSVWTQILADVLGRNLLVLKQPEVSMRGAVLLALESLGKIGKTESIHEPRLFHPKCHDIYATARRRHENYYRSLIADRE